MGYFFYIYLHIITLFEVVKRGSFIRFIQGSAFIKIHCAVHLGTVIKITRKASATIMRVRVQMIATLYTERSARIFAISLFESNFCAWR